MGSSSNLISAKKQQEKSFNNAKQEKLDQLFNYGFHQQQKGYISQIIVKHINSWETYQIESKEMNQFYKDLERDHSYIQWLFPNFFKSNFNFDSYSLTIIERNEMVNDKKVMDFYLKNYKMTLRFFGIKWGIEMLEFENNQRESYVLGQREEALKLLEFIYQQNEQLYFSEYKCYDLLKDEEQNGFTKSVNDKNQIIQTQQKEDIKKDKEIVHQKEVDNKLQLEQNPKKINDKQMKRNLDTNQAIKSESKNKSQEHKNRKLSNKQQHQNNQKIQQVQTKQNTNEKQHQLQNSISNSENYETAQIVENAFNQDHDFQKKNNFIHEKFKRQINVQCWNDVKHNYVPQDKIQEKWVNINLLTKKILHPQSL